ncbi:MAG: J domain-containing protein, partial [Pseudomonadota bacterium]
MTISQPTPVELYNACRTIFGPEVSISIEFLNYLQPVGLKTAYRKRALETHPDRAKTLGFFARDLHEEFKNVRLAYEKLLIFVETKNKISSPADCRFGTKKSSPRQPSGTSSYNHTTYYPNQARQQHTVNHDNRHYYRSG